MEAGRAAPQGTPNPAAEVRQLRESLQGADHLIDTVHEQMDNAFAAWADEKLKLCHKVHNGRYRVNRLEGLIDLRENEFKDELKRSIETVSKQKSEISHLQTSLKCKEEQMEAAQRFSQEQMEKMAARLEAEKQKVSELTDQMFKASVESQRTASLQKESQVKVDHLKQQLQQRDTVILDLRKEKEAVSQKLVETSAQLRRKEKEVLQSGNLWEDKYKALRELAEKVNSRMAEVDSNNKRLVERERTLMTKVQELERRNKELVESEKTLMTRFEDVEEKNKQLAEKEKALTTRIQDMEEEKRDLELVKEEDRQREESVTKMKNEDEEVKAEEINIKEENIEDKNKTEKENKRIKKEEKKLKAQKEKEEKKQKEREKMEQKKRQEREDKERKQKEKEEKLRKEREEKEQKKRQEREEKERKQKEKEERKQKERKPKKRFWMFMKKGDEETKVEEAACCSAEADDEAEAEQQ
uniref:golgin subfamily A member 6-like protein 6 n=1 Tax=Semicossyphus pulcher TaxID=241346 RepID=UPI0037E8A392